MLVPQLEKEIGIEVYITQTKGLGGKIRQLASDFIVEELLVDGSLAEVSEPSKSWNSTGEGSYLICVLVKQNWDTFLSVKRIAQKLRISQKRIRFEEEQARTVSRRVLGNVVLLDCWTAMININPCSCITCVSGDIVPFNDGRVAGMNKHSSTIPICAVFYNSVSFDGSLTVMQDQSASAIGCVLLKCIPINGGRAEHHIEASTSFSTSVGYHDVS